jgi:hypothetical protein
MVIFIVKHAVDHDGGASVRADMDVYSSTLCDLLNRGLMCVVCNVADQLVLNKGGGVKEICPRGNNNIVIIIFLVHDNVYIPC